MPMEHRIGNSRADRWADYAASLVACGEDHRNNVALQDAGGWLIRKRFICICQHFLTKAPKKDPPIKRVRTDRCGMLDNLGHQTTAEGHNIVCHVCCSTWPKLGELHIYERADICPGIHPLQLTLCTKVGMSSGDLVGADMRTREAPASRCFLAPSTAVKRPVDSST